MATSTKNRSGGDDGGTNTTSLAVGAAVGLAAGLAANFVRKAVVQAPTVAAGNWDAALAAEHKATLAIFDALEKTDQDDSGKRATLLMQMKHALLKHAVQEEDVVYDALRNNQKIEEADHLNHDHGYFKQNLYDLTVLPKDSPEWLPKLRTFRVLIEEHMREEEDEIFPAMRAQLSEAENKALTKEMNKEGLKVA